MIRCWSKYHNCRAYIPNGGMKFVEVPGQQDETDQAVANRFLVFSEEERKWMREALYYYITVHLNAPDAREVKKLDAELRSQS